MEIKEQYYKQTQTLAREAFKDHILSNQTLKLDNPRRYLIKHPDRSFYWTEIIDLACGRLFVGGDIDDCTFGYLSSSFSDKIKLIANSHLDYVVKKAQMGSEQ